jgi:RimJ/RimL family protein N-acetyltransferase
MIFVKINDELILRNLEDQDAPTLYQLLENNRDRTSQYLVVDAGSTLDVTRVAIQQYKEDILSRKGIYVGIFVRGSLSGQIRLEVHRDSPDPRYAKFSCNLAYWLSSGQVGRGIVYKCLRVLLPYSVEHFWNDRTITRVEAEIGFDNFPSQSIVKRLGLSISGPDSATARILDIIAPHKTYFWTMDLSQSLQSQLEYNEIRYESCRHEKRSRRDSMDCETDVLNSFNQVIQEADMGNLADLIDEKLELLPQLVNNQAVLESQLMKLDNTRVIPDSDIPSSAFSIVDWNGLWVPETLNEIGEGNSCIVIHGESVVRGFNQCVQSFLKGLVPREQNRNTIVFYDGKNNEVHRWERLSPKYANGLLLDGIWYTSRAYVGIFRNAMVSSLDLWSLQLKAGRWSLVLPHNSEYFLTVKTGRRAVWKPIVQPKRFRGRRNKQLDLIEWYRVPDGIGQCIARAVLTRFGTDIIRVVVQRLEVDNHILEKLGQANIVSELITRRRGLSDQLGRMQKLYQFATTMFG